MKELDSTSIVIPYRNWRLDVAELCFKSLDTQISQPDEVMVVDISSAEPYRKGLKKLCKKYGVRYIAFSFDLPDKVIDVHLWNICFNHGIRLASNDIILPTGIDRVFENNMVECIVEWYNWFRSRRKVDPLICGAVWNLKRVPELSELENFEALFDEAKWRGGYAFYGASKEWFHMTRGFDETLRWYEELDLAARAHKVALKSVIWASHGRITDYLKKHTRTLHIAIHPPSRKRYREPDVEAIARRGRFDRAKHTSIARNDKDWGIVTERKIQRALWLSKLTQEEFDAFYEKGVDPLEYDNFE